MCDEVLAIYVTPRTDKAGVSRKHADDIRVPGGGGGGGGVGEETLSEAERALRGSNATSLRRRPCSQPSICQVQPSIQLRSDSSAAAFISRLRRDYSAASISVRRGTGAGQAGHRIAMCDAKRNVRKTGRIFGSTRRFHLTTHLHLVLSIRELRHPRSMKEKFSSAPSDQK